MSASYGLYWMSVWDLLEFLQLWIVFPLIAIILVIQIIFPLLTIILVIQNIREKIEEVRSVRALQEEFPDREEKSVDLKNELLITKEFYQEQE